MPTLQRFLFMGCILFVASFSFCLTFLGVLVYLAVVSTEPNFVVSPAESANAIVCGLGAVVLTVRIGCFVARSIVRARLHMLPMIMAFAGYAATGLLTGGLCNYIMAPYF